MVDVSNAEFDVERTLELIRESLGYGRVPRTEAFFRWKHLDNPFGPSIRRMAYDDDGTLVALRMFQRWGLQRRGFRVDAVRAVDTATAPRAQGRGLFKRLTMEAVAAATADEVDLVFNTPNEKSGAGYLKMGWVEVGRPGVFMRVTRPPLRGRLEGDIVDPEAVAASAAGSTPDDSRLRTATSSAYFRWRYLDIPGFEYRMHRHGTAVAVFRRQTRRRVPELTVCELRHPDTVAGARDAGRVLRDLTTHGGAFIVSAAAPLLSTTSLALLGGAFAWTPLGPRLFTRPLAMRRVDPMPITMSAWGLGIGDLEIF